MKSYYSYIQADAQTLDDANRASYKGIAKKTIVLSVCMILVAALTAFLLPTILSNYFAGFYVTLIFASIVGFISVIVGRLSDRAAKVASAIYCVCEGLIVGTATAIVNAYVPGAGVLAFSATLIIFGVMVALYSVGILHDGSKLRMITLGILISIVCLFVFDLVYILATGTESYGLWLVIQFFLLIYGVITLTFNFAEAEAVVNYGCSADAEWSVALGILVSLVYIYVELLRLIAIFADRR